MNKAIEIKDYSFRYSGTEQAVLSNCSLTLHYGEFMVLSGLSGEGKSTLLASVNGIIPNSIGGEQEGQILIDGEPVAGRKMAELSRRVGSVLQNADSQIVHARVEDEIAFGCENRGMEPKEIHRRVRAACVQMELDPDWATKTLSGGQKQRLITASTLAMGQKILVFDEPLANLDLQGAHMLLDTLRRLTREEGYAVLFVEHRLDVVIPYADTVAWLENGAVSILTDKQEALCKSSHLIPDTGEAGCSSQPCFEVKHLCFSAGGREILKDISFTVKKGERVVILGENGCGKTTLLRLIARLQKPTGGEIVQHLSPAFRKKTPPKWFAQVGYVYQNPNYQLFMPLVREEVAFQAQDDGAAEWCLRTFDLTGLQERHPQSLSEGQKRRLGVAALSAGHPQVLLLDEPTVGQDYDNLRRMVDTVNQLHREQKITTITVTHDYRCAAALADHVVWIRDGIVFREGGKELIDEYFQAGQTMHAQPR